MELKLSSHSSSQFGSVIGVTDNISAIDAHKLTHSTFCQVAQEKEDLDNPALSIKWIYTIFYLDNPIFDFSTTQYLEIAETTIAPELSDIESIIDSSIYHFRHRSQEKKMLPSDLPRPEDRLQALQQLYQALDNLNQSSV